MAGPLTLAALQPYLPVLGIGGLIVVAAIIKHNRDKNTQPGTDGQPDDMGNTGQMTPDRQAVYVQTLQSTDPAQMNQMADSFQAAGLNAQAGIIRKRAQLANLPQAMKDQRESILRQALQSQNKRAVLAMASAFHGEGCWVAGEALYKYAASLP